MIRLSSWWHSLHCDIRTVGESLEHSPPIGHADLGGSSLGLDMEKARNEKPN